MTKKSRKAWTPPAPLAVEEAPVARLIGVRLIPGRGYTPLFARAVAVKAVDGKTHIFEVVENGDMVEFTTEAERVLIESANTVMTFLERAAIDKCRNNRRRKR